MWNKELNEALWAQSTYAKKISKKYKKERKHEERDEQEKFVNWLKLNNIPHHAIPNGGSRNILEAINLKKSGVQEGVPDLFIPIATPYNHGLYIEMKKKADGRITKEQKKWIDDSVDRGYCAVACNGYDEAKSLVIKYLKYTKIKINFECDTVMQCIQ